MGFVYQDPEVWVAALAQQAQIRLTQKELTRFSAELPTMLRAMDALADAAPYDLCATPQGAVDEDALRKDLCGVSLPRAEALAAARAQNGACFLSSSVMGDGKKEQCVHEADKT